jgi:hypothetical protein
MFSAFVPVNVCAAAVPPVCNAVATVAPAPVFATAPVATVVVLVFAVATTVAVPATSSLPTAVFVIVSDGRVPLLNVPCAVIALALFNVGVSCKVVLLALEKTSVSTSSPDVGTLHLTPSVSTETAVPAVSDVPKEPVVGLPRDGSEPALQSLALPTFVVFKVGVSCKVVVPATPFIVVVTSLDVAPPERVTELAAFVPAGV